MNRTRDYRRAKEKKKKDKVRGWFSLYYHHNLDMKPTKKEIGLFAKTHKQCTDCCGNPRKHYGQKTLREIKFEEDFEEWDEFSESDYRDMRNRMMWDYDDYDDEYYIRYDISDEIWDEFVHKQADR